MSPESGAAGSPRRTKAIVVVATALAVAVAVAAVLASQRDSSGASPDATGTSDPPATTAVQRPSSSSTTTTTTIDERLGSGETVTLAFAGDTYAEGVLADRLDADPTGFVGPYTDILASADLAVLNLETAITEAGTPLPKQFTFRAPPRVLDALAAGGIDVVSLANNHGMDYGITGLEDTVAAKRAASDIEVIGIGLDEDEAYAPAIVEVEGQRIAVIGATQVLDSSLLEMWTAGPDKPGLASAKRVDRLVAEVERIRQEADTVVVVVHWGVETHTCPTEVQMSLARALVDAGADIVVGGHQHRVASGGMLDGAVIHYGLGNFIFKENSAAGAQTGVLLVDITGQQVESYRWVPGRITNSVPAPLEGEAAAAALADWNQKRSCTDLSE